MSSPPPPGSPRIGDDEREQAIRALGEHYSRGRLDVHEFDERVREATQARTASEIAPLFADLPGPHPAFLAPPAFGTGMPYAGPPRYPAPAPTHDDRPFSAKSKVAAGVMQIFLPFGIGRFYTGHTGLAIGQMVAFFVGLLLCGVGAIPAIVWCFIDGIVLLTSDSTDSEGRRLRS